MSSEPGAGQGCALLLTRRRYRLGLLVTALSAACLALFSPLPVANWIILPLEQRFPASSPEIGDVSGIIVLGGAVEAGETFAREQLTMNDSAERIIAMGDLARRYPNAKVIFSGGAGTLLTNEPSEAAAVHRFLPALGLDADRIVFETQSRNTYENAYHVRALVGSGRSDRWLLVTSAFHMPRAMGCFRQAGSDRHSIPSRFPNARSARRMAALRPCLRGTPAS